MLISIAGMVATLIIGVVGGALFAGSGWKSKYDHLMRDLVAAQRQIKQIDEQDKMLKNAKAMLSDMQDMNNTTVKLNDFYSKKIGAIQQILNEKE